MCSQNQIKSGKKFYCKSCNSFYSKIEAYKQILYEQNIKRYLCPNCMIQMIQICPFCKKGLMVKPEIPKTIDYNEQGIIEAFCSNCGKGFIEFKDGWNNNLKISRRNIKNLINKILMKNNLPFNDFKNIENNLCKTFKTRTEIIQILQEEFNEDPGFIEKNLNGQIFLG